MAPSFPIEVDVFSVPHSRMKELVSVYMDQMSQTDFQNHGSLECLLNSLQKTFCELKSHEYIENQFIMEKLKARLHSLNVASNAVCNCHRDSRLTEILKLVQEGFGFASKTLGERLYFGSQLRQAVQEFTETFLPHMQEEEEVFQPLLMKYFEYDELCSLKNVVIEQHELWKEKLFVEKENIQNLGVWLSSLADEVVDRCVESEDEWHETLQTLHDTLQQSFPECQASNEYHSREEYSWHFLPSESSTNRPLSSLSVKSSTSTFTEPSLIDIIPYEVMLNIFAYLSPVERAKCAQVCKRWDNMVYSSSLWRSVYPANWAKGRWTFQYFDPVIDLEKECVKLSVYDEDADIDESETEESLCYQERCFFDKLLASLFYRVGNGVQNLYLGGSQGLTRQQLRSMILYCPNLHLLDISYTTIDDRAFEGLARNGAALHLRHIDFSGCSGITDVGLTLLGACFRLGEDEPRPKLALEDGCQGCTKPCRLRFSNKSCGNLVERRPGSWGSKRSVSSDSRSELSSECSVADGLEYVSLSGCVDITEQGLRALLATTLTRQTLTYLDLSGCPSVCEEFLWTIAQNSTRLIPENLYYCNLLENGPYPAEANGCQNLACPWRACCCLGE